jgi:UDP-3-O-acyl-N-acetylglucosamine deacetylase
MEIQFAGVRTAPQRNGSTEGVRRHALQVDQPLTVTDGDSFITFVPEQLTRVTCGVNYSNEAPVSSTCICSLTSQDVCRKLQALELDAAHGPLAF